MPYKILLVEDEELIRHFMDVLLQLGDYYTVEAEDGTEALDLLEMHDFDLLIVDNVLPGDMSGEELIQRVRADARWHDIPIIYFSGIPADWKQIGADAFIQKPSSPQDILETVRWLLEHHGLL